VVDGSEPLKREDFEILSLVQGKQSVIAVNKNDLPMGFALEELRGKIPQAPLISISALCGSGIESLKDAIRQMILAGSCESSSEILLSNLRHKQAIERSRKALDQALDSLSEGLSVEFISVDLQEAQAALGEIVGSHAAEDILNRIFDQFCIGK
jgi:tRNA modification GTPase